MEKSTGTDRELITPLKGGKRRAMYDDEAGMASINNIRKEVVRYLVQNEYADYAKTLIQEFAKSKKQLPAKKSDDVDMAWLQQAVMFAKLHCPNAKSTTTINLYANNVLKIPEKQLDILLTLFAQSLYDEAQSVDALTTFCSQGGLGSAQTHANGWTRPSRCEVRKKVCKQSKLSLN